MLQLIFYAKAKHRFDHVHLSAAYPFTAKLIDHQDPLVTAIAAHTPIA